MTKSFLTYSAIVEALTGIGLIFAPSTVAAILLKTELVNPLERLLAMVAGAAISSLALSAWITRLSSNPSAVIKMLLLYNAAVTAVLLYGILALGFGGIVLWTIILFHFIQSAISTIITMKSAK